MYPFDFVEGSKPYMNPVFISLATLISLILRYSARTLNPKPLNPSLDTDSYAASGWRGGARGFTMTDVWPVSVPEFIRSASGPSV